MDVVKGWHVEKGDRNICNGSSEQAIRTNLIKAKIDKTQQESKQASAECAVKLTKVSIIS